MNHFPITIGALHFIGIGGIGMSGIAQILHSMGFTIQGSDLQENANVKRLKALGMKIYIEHKAEYVHGVYGVVVSSAVRETNVEIQYARLHKIPVISRSEMLAEILRLKSSVSIAGSHGKTTTTSLFAAVFYELGLDPTVINGGILNSIKSNARLGGSAWAIVEADESDGTFIRIPSMIAIVTSIDPEHLDYYKTFENLKGAFFQFVENIPFYGFACLCVDSPKVQSLVARISNRKVITYGLTPQANVRAMDVCIQGKGTSFSVRFYNEACLEEGFFLPMFGNHNVNNALASIAVAYEMGWDLMKVRKALREFKGVKRRFTYIDCVDDITFMDDYAHHPVEIQAVLNSALAVSKGQIIVVYQPHRYSRLQGLFEDFCHCFNFANHVFILPVFEAGEDPIAGASHRDLVQGLLRHGHRSVEAAHESSLVQQIACVVRPKDYVLFLGAGDITKLAYAFPDAFRQHSRG